MNICIGAVAWWLGKPDVQVTWEPASSLPVAAIQKFEKGLLPKIVQHTSDHYGHGTSIP